MLPHLILWQPYYRFHFTDEEAEAQSSYVLSQSLYSGKEIQNQNWELSDAKTNTFLYTSTWVGTQICCLELIQ